MNNKIPFDPKKEKANIITFLKKTFKDQHIDNAVIGLSGGIDSTVSFYLLSEILAPNNIYVAHLYYDAPIFSEIEKVLRERKIPKKNICYLSIKQIVDTAVNTLHVPHSDKMRAGNIAARVRMISLFDLAKKHNAMVVGTENKSENVLGYFTRFGDQASDIEPIEHLYKTQIFALAKYLGIPETIINQQPTAGLWKGQTDEGEFGFTYEEADQVLYLKFEKKLSTKEIIKQGYINAEKIILWRDKNLFKHQTPYKL